MAVTGEPLSTNPEPSDGNPNQIDHELKREYSYSYPKRKENPSLSKSNEPDRESKKQKDSRLVRMNDRRERGLSDAHDQLIPLNL